MKILFLTNASAKIGGGHVMRCLTLANALARIGAQIRFVVNRDAARFVPSLQYADFPVAEIDCLTNAPSFISKGGAVDLIVCDSYEIDESRERPLRQWSNKIVVIDDLADRVHDCDVLLDSTFGRLASDYATLVPPGARVLAGTRYALLRPEFLALRDESLARRAKSARVERILVSFGLTDVAGITARAVAALLALNLNARIDVVIAAHAPSLAALEELAGRHAQLALHIAPPHIERLMADADLAVGAGGTTSWERCCLGLPTVLLVLADNQQLVARMLAEAGAARSAQGANDEGVAGLVAAVRELVERPALLRQMSDAAASIVDGRGAERAAHAIRETLT